MSTHVKIIGWLHIIFGLLGVLTAFALFGGGMLGGMFSGSLKGMVGMGLIYTLWALLSAEGAALFKRRAMSY